MKLGIFGRGRLATALDTAARLADDPPAWCLGRDDVLPPASSSDSSAVDVVIDASAGSAVEQHLDWALDRGVDLVVAATGWSLRDLPSRVGEQIGVVVAPNGSLTVAFLARLTRLLGAFGRAQYPGTADGYLLDHHHAAKADAPSGTALRLADAWRTGHGDDLAVSSLRAGHEVGLHIVGLDAPGEQLEVTHRARSREPFAHGLLRAARWVVGRQGVFTLDDVAREAFAGTPLEFLFTDSVHSDPIGDRHDSHRNNSYRHDSHRHDLHQHDSQPATSF